MTQRERDLLQQEWEPRVQAFRASGLSGPQWCAQYGLKIGQLHYWNRKLRPSDADASENGWMALSTSTPTASGPETFCVTVGAASIMVSLGFDATLLQTLVRTLAAC